MELKPGYKLTEAGVIPEDWTAVTLEAVTTHIGDGLHGTPVYTRNADYYFINGNNLNHGKIIITPDTQTADQKEFAQHRKPLSNRSILMSINGTIGNLGLFQDQSLVLGKSVAYLNVRTDVSKLYVYHALQSSCVRQQFFDGLTGSTIGNLGLSAIRSTYIPLPLSDSEQASIAKALGDADDLLYSLDQLIIKKRSIKQAAMQELLTGKRRLPGFEGEWEVKRLGEIATIDPENLGSNTQPNYRFNYISLEDVDQGALLGWSEQEFSSAPYRARRRLRCKDVLVSTVRPNLKSHLLFCQDSGEWVCSTGFAALRCNGDLADQSYVYFHLFGGLLNKQVEALLTGSNYPAINSRDVRGLEIPVPSLPEQKAIARVLGSMEDEITLLTHRIEKASSLKQGMMQQLLTGRIRLT